MTGYLLDTNVVLRALTDPRSLSPRAKEAIRKGPNILSVLVYWEVLLKVVKGTLIVGQPQAWWLDALDMLGASTLPLTSKHVDRIQDLSTIHKDPFDRMLVAQASVEGIPLVTADRSLLSYRSKTLKVIL